MTPTTYSISSSRKIRYERTSCTDGFFCHHSTCDYLQSSSLIQSLHWRRPSSFCALSFLCLGHRSKLFQRCRRIEFWDMRSSHHCSHSTWKNASTHLACELASRMRARILCYSRWFEKRSLQKMNSLSMFNIFNHTHLRKYLHHSPYHFELHSLSQLRHASPDNKSWIWDSYEVWQVYQFIRGFLLIILVKPSKRYHLP